MNSYPLGAVVRVTGTFATNGVGDDPATVQAKVRQPNGSITTYTYGSSTGIYRDGIGVYHVDISTTLAGVWSYRFVGSGTGQAASEAEFFVQASDFGASG